VEDEVQPLDLTATELRFTLRVFSGRGAWKSDSKGLGTAEGLRIKLIAAEVKYRAEPNSTPRVWVTAPELWLLDDTYQQGDYAARGPADDTNMPLAVMRKVWAALTAMYADDLGPGPWRKGVPLTDEDKARLAELDKKLGLG